MFDAERPAVHRSQFSGLETSYGSTEVSSLPLSPRASWCRGDVTQSMVRVTPPWQRSTTKLEPDSGALLAELRGASPPARRVHRQARVGRRRRQSHRTDDGHAGQRNDGTVRDTGARLRVGDVGGAPGGAVGARAAPAGACTASHLVRTSTGGGQRPGGAQSRGGGSSGARGQLLR